MLATSRGSYLIQMDCRIILLKLTKPLKFGHGFSLFIELRLENDAGIQIPVNTQNILTRCCCRINTNNLHELIKKTTISKRH